MNPVCNDLFKVADVDLAIGSCSQKPLFLLGIMINELFFESSFFVADVEYGFVVGRLFDFLQFSAIL